MVDSKKKDFKPKPVVKKVKESKTDSFIRIAKPRVQSVLKTLRILGNCSNRANYNYTQEQTDKIFETIQEALNTTEAKFTPSKKEQEAFEF